MTNPAVVRPDQTLSSGLAIAGAFEGTHVGASLERAAVRRQIAVTRFDTQDAMRTNRVPRAVQEVLACFERTKPRLRVIPPPGPDRIGPDVHADLVASLAEGLPCTIVATATAGSLWRR